MRYRDFELDPFQAKAITAIEQEKSVIVAAPTGAGKTVIAEYAVEKSLREGKQIIYTSPIKALSNQKFRDFSVRWPGQVGIMTGDVTMNGNAPILIMTTEIFRNTLFEDPARVAGVEYVIFDEVHYINDLERGTVWEESIIFAPQNIKFICLSATIPNLNEIAEWIGAIRSTPMTVVLESHRPVPLIHKLFMEEAGILGLPELKKVLSMSRARKKDLRKHGKKYLLLDEVIRKKRLPCLYFCFGRTACENHAKASRKFDLLTPAERETILTLFHRLCDQFQYNNPKDKNAIQELIERGVAYHHAGMMPTLKEIVERLFTSGLLKLLFTTETFALGINMPAKTVCFDSLRKWDGISFDYLKTRDYYQMAGRAGRRGIDTEGYVYATADLGRGDYRLIHNIIRGEPEPALSRFNLAYSSILNLHHRLGEEKMIAACEKSLSTFQAAVRARRKNDRKDRRDRRPMHERLLTMRIKVLEELGYIASNTVTPRGKFAMSLQGYELQITEIFFRGILEKLDPSQLCALLMAVVFEARPGVFYRKIERDLLGGARYKAHEVIEDIQSIEDQMGLNEWTKPLDFRMSMAAHAWSKGEAFENLIRFSDCDPGDLIRNFRLLIQQMRQLKISAKGDANLQERLGLALDSINRDEVDAERQLRLGERRLDLEIERVAEERAKNPLIEEDDVDDERDKREASNRDGGDPLPFDDNEPEPDEEQESDLPEKDGKDKPADDLSTDR